MFIILCRRFFIIGKRNLLKSIDIVIGSDICFCDLLIDPIRRFINRAKKASVAQVFISDPGRLKRFTPKEIEKFRDLEILLEIRDFDIGFFRNSKLLNASIGKIRNSGLIK